MILEEGVHYDKVGLKHYRLIQDIYIETGIAPPEGFRSLFGCINSTGGLTLFRGFVWDGATGAVDTKQVMYPSLVHDWWCNNVNNGNLPVEYRAKADKLFYKMLLESGMDRTAAKRFRAAYMGWAVLKWGEIKHGVRVTHIYPNS